MKKIIYLIFMILLIPAMAACSDDDEKIPEELVGKWKLAGFADGGSNELRIPEPRDCEECYVLDLRKNGTFEGHSSTNIIEGKYTAHSNTKEFIILSISGTKINELYDGELYIESLQNINSYSITENELCLYHNNNYIFFIPYMP